MEEVEDRVLPLALLVARRRIDVRPAEPAELTREFLSKALGRAALSVHGTAATFAHWTRTFMARPNELPDFGQEMFQRAGGDPEIFYLHGYWSLKPGEAWVIETDVPDCPYWNFQLDNFGEGGSPGDPIQGLVQAGAVSGGEPTFTGRDNAYMLTLPDGIPPWSGMFLWEPIDDAFEGPCADGDFDAGVIQHEYSHGLSNRYVGTEDGALGSHQSGSMGEGWGSLVGVDFQTSGIPTEEAYRDLYLQRTGRGPVEDWPFYMAFSIFRLASISQGVYRRVLAGTVASAREAVNGTQALADQALSILHGDR